MPWAKSSPHITKRIKDPKIGLGAHPSNSSIWEAKSGELLWVSRKQNQELTYKEKKRQPLNKS